MCKARRWVPLLVTPDHVHLLLEVHLTLVGGEGLPPLDQQVIDALVGIGRCGAYLPLFQSSTPSNSISTTFMSSHSLREHRCGMESKHCPSV